MFKNMGQLAGLLRNAGQIKANMEQVQERLKVARFVGEAGAEQVKATVDGRGELVAIEIDPATAGSGDTELLEDLIVASVRSAVAKSREGAQKEIQEAAGGIDLSRMMDMIGGGGPA